MGKIRKNQSGFSAIEGLLILVIVAILGFTGWFVWHAKQNADKNLAANTSTTPSFKKQNKPSSTTTATQQNTPSPHPASSKNLPPSVVVSSIKLSPATIYCKVGADSHSCNPTASCSGAPSTATVTMDITNSDEITGAQVSTYWVGPHVFSQQGPSFPLTRTGSSTWKSTLIASNFPSAVDSFSPQYPSQNTVSVRLTVKDNAVVSGLSNNYSLEGGGDVNLAVASCSS